MVLPGRVTDRAPTQPAQPCTGAASSLRPTIRSRTRQALGWSFTALAVLAAGALLVGSEADWLVRADTSALALADATRSPLLDTFFGTITWLGSLMVLAPAAVLIAGWLAATRRPCAAVTFVPLAAGGAALLAHLGKWIVARPRPDLHAGLIVMPVEPSYPSAHAMQVVAFWLAVSLVWRPRTIAARWLGAALVSAVTLAVLASRVYLQVHFPSDVAFGAITAACWALVLNAAIQPGHPPRNC